MRIASSLATGANVSSKSIPSTWVYPWATRRALFLTTWPCSSCLFRYIHFVPIMLCLRGSGRLTSSQTLFSLNYWSSSCIAWTHSGSIKASATFLGSDIDTNEKCPQKFANCVALERVSGPGALMLSIIFSICTSFATRGWTGRRPCSCWSLSSLGRFS